MSDMIDRKMVRNIIDNITINTEDGIKKIKEIKEEIEKLPDLYSMRYIKFSCKGCIHVSKQDYESPCRFCYRSHPIQDMWTPKENKS